MDSLWEMSQRRKPGVSSIATHVSCTASSARMVCLWVVSPDEVGKVPEVGLDNNQGRGVQALPSLVSIHTARMVHIIVTTNSEGT